MFAKRIDIEEERFATGRSHRLAFQINNQPITLSCLYFSEQTIHVARTEHYGQQADLEAIVEKNIGEAGRDDYLETIVLQRPRCMFPARTTAEICTRKQYLCIVVTQQIEYEIRIRLTLCGVYTRLAVIQITPLIEQIPPETRSLDGFQKLLGNNGVGVDVCTIQRRHQPLTRNKFFHRLFRRFLNRFPTLLNILPHPTHGITCGQLENSNQAVQTTFS